MDTKSTQSIGPLLRSMIEAGQISDPASPKGRLLAAAAMLFRKKGYAGTTVRDLAAEVGILSGSIFHHFKNKDEILFGVMKEVVSAMNASLEQILALESDPAEKVRALIENELVFIHGSPGDASAVLVYEWRALSADKQVLILEQRDVYEAMWLDALEEAREAGLTRIESDVLRQLLHGAVAWSVNWYEPGGALSMEDLIDRTLSLVLQK
jgi:AcrR family transcriptional regulator